MTATLGAALMLSVLPACRPRQQQAAAPRPPLQQLGDLPPNFMITGSLAPGALTGGAQLRLRGQRSVLTLDIRNGGIRVSENRDGQQRPAVVAELPEAARQRPLDLSLVKTEDLVELFADGRHLLHVPVAQQNVMAFEDAGDGRTPALSGLRLQKLGSVYFADEFMRTPDSPNQWQEEAGEWELSGRPNPSRSANAFAYRCAGSPARALVGQNFWRNYRYACSVKPQDASSFSLLFAYGADGSHYAVTWTAENGGELELKKVQPNGAAQLASAPLEIAPDCWYRVAATSWQGRLRVSVDATVLLRASDPDYLVGGRVGLQADAPDGVLWDDVLVESVKQQSWEFSRLEDLAILGVAPGRDQAEPSGLPRLAACEPVTFHGMRHRNAFAEATLSGVKIPAVAKEPLELRLRVEDPANYCFLRVSPKDAACDVVIGVMDRGAERVLDQARIPSAPQMTLRFEAQDRILLGRVNGEVAAVAQTPVPPVAALMQLVPPGDWGKTDLAGLTAGLAEPMQQLNRVHRTFVAEKSMSIWSHPGNDWLYSKTALGSCHWHRTDFWSDFDFTVDLRRLGEALGDWKDIGIVVAAPEDQDQAQAARYVLRRAGSEFMLLAGIGAQMDRSLSVDEGAGTRYFSVQRRGDRLLLLTDNRVRWIDRCRPEHAGLVRLGIAGIDPAAASRRWVATSKKRAVDSAPEPPQWPGAIELRADSVHTYTFAAAPADWAPAGGTWEITNRWECDPRWSFFAGYNLDGPACLWHKFPHGDRVTLEFFAAPKMDRARGDHYQYAADLNAVISADGISLDSGYTALFGGRDDAGSYVCRRGKPVISSTEEAIPRSSSIHHRWFYMKIRRNGNRLQYWVDGELVGQFEDPEPLTGSYLALWTWHNAMMVSQVRISTDDGAAPEPALRPAGTPVATAYTGGSTP